ncbi:MAG: glutamate racemase [Oceanococcaceae bacterium]
MPFAPTPAPSAPAAPTVARPVRVGVFDSGVGGLSVLREILTRAPALDVHYHADQRRIPWGPQPVDELHRYCHNISQQLARRGCTHIVVACNTASAVALQTLRAEFPTLTFVGMEPAIKPAATLTRSGVIGLLATPATLAGELLANTRARHAAHVDIVSDPCVGLVDAIESGDEAHVHARLNAIVPPLLARGADVLVLGCTHYPFALATLAALAGPAVRLVDPAPAVARQLLRVIGEAPHEPASGLPENASSPAPGRVTFSTSGHPDTLRTQIRRLLGHDCEVTSEDWAALPLPMAE